ncbi:DUF2970 domain-containing protein [Pelosinus sp. UFO1]|nr:DUF2970 domain-containing protein [Pelosinus sp. UFO1]AIF51204.1 Protein of unknown function DUF2970 [Pelosinus sp. UFO1]
MTKGMGKRAHHRQDMKKLNQTALTIGGVLGAICLIAVIVSLLYK